MALEPWLRLIHIAAAITWLGGGAALAMIGLRARTAGDAVLLVAFGRNVQFVGTRVFGPSAAILLLAGIGLVLAQSRSFTETWVLVALGGFVLAFAAGAMFLARPGIELSRAVAEATPDPERIRVLAGRWLRGYAIVLAILVVILWDMVFKPGL